MILSYGEKHTRRPTTEQKNVKHSATHTATIELFIQLHAVLPRQTKLLIGLDKGLDLERLMLRDGLLICGRSWPSSY